MTRSLPRNPSISLLKKQAKKLLKQFREGNADALTSIKSNHPKPEAFVGLRDAQLVIARTYGFAGWKELSEAVELTLDAAKDLPNKAELFIKLGCVQYQGNDLLRNYQRASKLLVTYPEIAEFDFYSALVANNSTAVSKFLQSDPTLAAASGGPLAMPALLYVVYSRVSEREGKQDSLSIIKMLLEHGANPNSHILLDGTNRFTALTGAMGEGEQGVNQPPHQYADQMAALLLDAGANPNDGQGLYNTMFTDSGDKWLALLISKGLHANDRLNWDDAGNDKQAATLDYQLSCAVDRNRLSRVSLLLDAGANPNARNTYNDRAVHTNALLAGHAEIAQLLQNSGAIAEKLNFKDQFILACVGENYDAISRLIASHPKLLEDATLMHAAAEHASLEIVKALIAHGFDIDGLSKQGRTLLHQCAMKNDTAQVQELLSLGARIDIQDRSYGSIAAGFASYCGSYEAMRLLLDASDSLLHAVSCSYLARAKDIIDRKEEAIHEKSELGNTVLHVIGYWLHDEPDYDTYESMVGFLIASGADINLKNNEGQTPIEFHVSNGYEILAELLREYS